MKNSKISVKIAKSGNNINCNSTIRQHNYLTDAFCNLTRSIHFH